MADVSISISHDRSREEIERWLEEKLRLFKRKFPRENVEVERREGRWNLESRKFSATISYDDSSLSIEVKLPLLFKVFKSQIRSALLSYLRELEV